MNTPFKVLKFIIDELASDDHLLLITKKNSIHIVRNGNDSYFITKNNNVSFCLNKKETMRYLLKKRDWISIDIYGNLGKSWDFNPANIIQRAVRKYLLRTARIRNDLVIHGLMERWFHPSKINFEIP